MIQKIKKNLLSIFLLFEYTDPLFLFLFLFQIFAYMPADVFILTLFVGYLLPFLAGWFLYYNIDEKITTIHSKIGVCCLMYLFNFSLTFSKSSILFYYIYLPFFFSMSSISFIENKIFLKKKEYSSALLSICFALSILIFFFHLLTTIGSIKTVSYCISLFLKVIFCLKLAGFMYENEK